MSELRFGETYVNRENLEAMQGFHAGWRKSGIGGADGKHGVEEYLVDEVGLHLRAGRGPLPRPHARPGRAAS